MQGTPIADVVEYLERAQSLVRGERMVDALAIRAIGVSLIHAPVLWLADLLGIAHGPWVLVWAGIVHMAIACTLIVGTVRLGRSLARAVSLDERRVRLTGWVSGFVTLASPAFIQFAAIPMTDIAAAAAFAFGLDFALFRNRPAAAGVGLGLSALFGFKAIPLVALGFLLAVLATFLSKGLRESMRAAGFMLLPIVVLALLQAVSDQVTYGEFGESLRVYLLVNLGHHLARLLNWLDFHDQAAKVYIEYTNLYRSVSEGDLDRDAVTFQGLRRHMLQLEYFDWFLARLLMPFAVLAAFLGTWRAWRRTKSREPVGASIPRRSGRLARLGLALAFAAPMLVTTAFVDAAMVKGSLEIRVLLPVLPTIAAVTGLGLLLFAGPNGGTLARPRAALAALALGAALVQCVLLGTENSPSHPVHWNGREQAAFSRAARFVGTLPAPNGRRGKVASSYHWAVLFRTTGDWDLTKLPHQLDGLGDVEPDQRQAIYSALLDQDVLIVHSSLLRVPPESGPWAMELFDRIAGEFHVVAAFWERSVDVGFGPVLVLAKETPPGVERRVLWRNVEAPPVGSLEGPVAPATIRLLRILGETTETIEIPHVRGTVLPGDGLFWVEVDLELRTPKLVARHYALHMDVRDANGESGYASLRKPSWRKRGLQDLPGGRRITEGFLLTPRSGSQDLTQPAAPIEDSEAVTIWFDICTHHRDEAGNIVVTGRLEAVDPGRGDHAERDDKVQGSGGPGWFETDDGFRYSKRTGALLIGTFERVQDEADDGWALRLERPLSGE